LREAVYDDARVCARVDAGRVLVLVGHKCCYTGVLRAAIMAVELRTGNR